MLKSLERSLRKAIGTVPIQTVLVLPFILQVIGIVGLVAYLSYRSGQRSIEELAFELTEEVSERVSDRLNSFLETPHQLIALNRRSIEAELLATDSNTPLQLDRYIPPFLRQIQTFKTPNSVGLTLADGRYLSVEQGISSQTEAYTLTRCDALAPCQVYRYQLSGERGDASSSAEPNLELLQMLTPYNAKQLPPYRVGSQVDQPSWTPIYPAQGIAESAFSAVAPIRVDNQLIGVLESEITLSQISTFLSRLEIARAGQVFIMERSGDLVATSTLEAPFLKLPGEPVRRLQADASTNPLTRAVVETLQQRQTELDHMHYVEYFELTHDHVDTGLFAKRYFVEVFPYKDQYGLDWLVVVVLPATEFVGELRENVRQTFIWSGLALLGAIAIGVYTTRWIARPILGLRDSANRLARGESTIDIPSTPILEVRQLAFSFREMANQLQLSLEELQALNQDLTQERTQIEHFLNAIPVGIAIHQPNGKITYFNRQAMELLGVDHISDIPIEKMAASYQIYVAGGNELYPAERLPAFRALNGECCFVEDMEILRGNLRITVEMRATPIYSEVNVVTHAIVAFQDITQRKDAEKVLTDYNQELTAEVEKRTQSLQLEVRERLQIEGALRQRESTLGAILTAIPDLLLRMTADGRYIEFISSGEVRTVSLTPDLTGHHLTEVLPPDLAERRRRGIQQAIATNEIQIDEYQVEINGEVRCEESRIIKISKDEVLVMVRDISDRKRTEAALKQSETQNLAILRAIPDLMFRLRRDGICLGYVRTSTLTDLLPPDFNPVGKDLLDVLPAEILERELSAMHRALETQQLQVYEQENFVGGRFQYEEVRVIPSGDDEALFLVRDISDRRRVERELRLANLRLEQLAQTDSLTGVANRRHFEDRLQQAWDSLLIEQHPLSLLLFDVDFFKRYNDTYGHQTGDECLIRLTEVAQQVIRQPADLIARYGGEEFIIILPYADMQEAAQVAERLCDAVRQLKIPHNASGVSEYVTISVGVSSVIPSPSLTSDLLIRQADDALYTAKQQGRDRSVVFDYQTRRNRYN
ncbi:diguanylate cyclase domain-containing protein [Vacuolonema iberomarrocanum]|uniref:diguanylate cyclase domain-containing protein n=1 Tax=Vacuolonema iberomarrocanum TaxID=3454632 RepID=UPI001A02F38D|nr:diguanylate cyclase [filamentous cyanobacterium LEGE 07170]